MFLGYSWVDIKWLVKPNASLVSRLETWSLMAFVLLQDLRLLVADMQAPENRLYPLLILVITVWDNFFRFYTEFFHVLLITMLSQLIFQVSRFSWPLMPLFKTTIWKDWERVKLVWSQELQMLKPHCNSSSSHVRGLIGAVYKAAESHSGEQTVNSRVMVLIILPLSRLIV